MSCSAVSSAAEKWGEKTFKKDDYHDFQTVSSVKLSQQSVSNDDCKNKQKSSNEDKSSATNNASCQQDVNHNH